MQFISETIDAPIAGSLDTDLDQAEVAMPFGRDLLQALRAMQEGDFSVRMVGPHDGLCGQIAEAVNVIAEANQRISQQLERIGDEVGREGRIRRRVKLGLPGRGWSELEDGLNRLIDSLFWPAAAITRAVAAVTGGDLEQRVAESAAELERSKTRLRDSEDSRTLALAAGKMGSWDWDLVEGHCLLDAGQRRIFGVDPISFDAALPRIRALVDRGDWKMLCRQLKRARQKGGAWQLEFRVRRPDGGVRWCLGTAVAARDAAGRVSRIRGITMDITERKEAEDRQLLLAREVDHRTKNALAVVHAIVSLTRAEGIEQFSASVEGRIHALARAHSLLSDSRWRGAKIADLIQGELASFRAASPERIRISGRSVALHPFAVQALALTLHELAANAVRHGALSVTPPGSVRVAWEQHGDEIELWWIECGVPCLQPPVQDGLGMRIIKASVESQLCGSVEFDWKTDGVCCVIRVPCDPKTEQFGNFLYSIQNPDSSRRIPALS